MSEEKRRILDMVEQGTITQEDAARLLEALGENEPAPAQPQESQPPQDGTWEAEHQGDEDCQGPNQRVEIHLEGEGAKPIYQEITAALDEAAPVFENLGKIVEDAVTSATQAVDAAWPQVKEAVSSATEKAKGAAQSAAQAAREELRVDTVSGGAYLSGFQAEECRVSTVSGAARCQGLRAQRLRVEAVSGAASLENVAAEELRCTTTSGKLELCGFAAQRLRAETVSGALTAGGNGEELSLSTVSGQLSLQVGQHPRQVKLNTVSGRIYAGLPEGEPGFTVEYSSMSGAFSSQFPLSGELGKRKGRAVYGSGGASLRLDTVSGAMEPQE